MTSTILMSSYSIFNSCYLNNKVTCEKFDVLLYATFGRPLDVQISPLSTRLQWTEKGRPMDVQYGTWTDGPNKDVLWTSFGRAMPIGVTIEEKIRKTASWFSLFFSPFSITSFACSFVFSYYLEWFLI